MSEQFRLRRLGWIGDLETCPLGERSKPMRVALAITKDSKNAVITITDVGIGIPADDLPHIFESFYRAQTVAAEQHPAVGYGLGLPLAREIVEIHNGTISVRSKENEGTIVTIKLPLT